MGLRWKSMTGSGVISEARVCAIVFHLDKLAYRAMLCYHRLSWVNLNPDDGRGGGVTGDQGDGGFSTAGWLELGQMPCLP